MDNFKRSSDRYSASRAGGLTDNDLLQGVEKLGDNLGLALIVDGGPADYYAKKIRLQKAWDNLLDVLTEIHNEY